MKAGLMVVLPSWLNPPVIGSAPIRRNRDTTGRVSRRSRGNCGTGRHRGRA